MRFAELLGVKRKSPPRPKPGGQEGRRTLLRVDPVAALALLGLERLDGIAGFLHRAGHEPADRVFLPAHLVHDLRQRGAVFPLEHRHHTRRLAAFARPGAFLRLLRLRSLLGLGRLLRGAGLLGRGGLRGRALWRLCANVGCGSAASRASDAVSATGSISAWSVASAWGRPASASGVSNGVSGTGAAAASPRL